MMARRIAALIGMLAVVLLALTVVWKVYQHRRSHVPVDEPTIVRLSHSFPSV